VERAVTRGRSRVRRARRRWPAVDHMLRARVRFEEVFGARLAAAIAYYGFFAAFALGVVSYALIGLVPAGQQAATDTVSGYLAQNLPWLRPDELVQSRNTVAVLGLVGLVVTGVAWVEAMRTAQRAVWGLEQQPGNLLVRYLVDLGMLAGLGALVALSLTLTGLLAAGTEKVLRVVAPEQAFDGSHAVLTVPFWLDWGSSAAIDMVLAAALLTAVPRLRIPRRRLRSSVLLVAGGLVLLTTVGRWLINRTRHNPAYAVVAGAAGLLLFLYLFNQLLLWGAALAATSSHGQVVDLAGGRTAVGDSADMESPGDIPDTAPGNGPAGGPGGTPSGPAARGSPQNRA
jgi:membrane protein